eukprot:2566983-Prymnesium_polylepis.1
MLIAHWLQQHNEERPSAVGRRASGRTRTGCDRRLIADTHADTDRSRRESSLETRGGESGVRRRVRRVPTGLPHPRWVRRLRQSSPAALRACLSMCFFPLAMRPRIHSAVPMYCAYTVVN